MNGHVNKLAEFAAHNGRVTCVSIGKKSAGVLVTGGEDKKVNLWTIGRNHQTMSLQGHQAAVESVAFDHNEEVVAAGAANGSIKIFDLEHAKVSKSFSSHKSSVLALEMQPSGMLSGSADTVVKCWDVRQREATHTFKGHKTPVTHVSFSPDGKWVVSGSTDGDVKMWDTRGQKLYKEYQHRGSVTGIKFSPVHQLLITSSQDKYIKVWDITRANERYEILADSSPVRALTMLDTGEAVVATQSEMKIWNVAEDSGCQYQARVEWTKVAEINQLKDKHKVIGCSFNENMVGLWVVSYPEPGSDPLNDEPSESAGGSRASGQRLNRPSSCRSSAVAPSASAPAMEPTVQMYQRPSVSANWEGPDIRSLSLQERAPAHASPHEVPVAQDRYSVAAQQHAARRSSGTPEQSHSRSIESAAPPPAAANPVSRARSAGPATDHTVAKPGMVSIAIGVGDSLLKPQSGGAGSAQQGYPSSGQRPVSSQPASRPNSGKHDPPIEIRAQNYQHSKYGDHVNQQNGREGDRRHEVGIRPVSRGHEERTWQQPSSSTAPEDVGREPRRRPESAARSDLDTIEALMRPCDDLTRAWDRRYNSVKVVTSFVLKRDLRGACQACRRFADPNVALDLLQASLPLTLAAFMKLEDVPDLVPVIEMVLGLPEDDSVKVGLDVTGKILVAFGDVIRSLCSQPAPRVVDLQYDERRQRAERARMVLQGLGTRIGMLARQSPGNSARARELGVQLGGL